MPSEASRVSVQVVLRDRMSTSPDCRAVKRCCAFSGTHLTLLASPSIAAAMALQASTSRPDHLPWLSAAEKPARPSLTPHTSWPRALIASTVLPACAGSAVMASAAVAQAVVYRDLAVIDVMKGGSWWCQSAVGRGGPPPSVPQCSDARTVLNMALLRSMGSCAAGMEPGHRRSEEHTSELH